METLNDPQLLHLLELFNHLDDVRAWIKDREHRICWINRTTFLLYSPGDPAGRSILGKTDHDLFPAFLADQYLLDDEYVLAGNRIVDRIEMNRLPDGTSVWHVTNKVPLVGRDGATIGTVGITRPLDKSEASAMGTEFGPVLTYMRDHHETPITNQQLARLATCRCERSNGGFWAASTSRRRHTFASCGCGWRVMRWSIPVNRCRQWPQTAVLRTKATSRASFAGISANLRESIANTTPAQAAKRSRPDCRRRNRAVPAMPGGRMSGPPTSDDSEVPARFGILSTKLAVLRQDISSHLCSNA